MTETNKQLAPVQLLDLVTMVERYVDHVKPLLTLILSNPCVDMNQYLQYDKTAREQLTRMTRMLVAATRVDGFDTISFMLGEDGKA